MLNIIKNIKFFFKRKYTKYRGDRVFVTSLVIGRKEILYKVMLDLYPSRYQLTTISDVLFVFFIFIDLLIDPLIFSFNLNNGLLNLFILSL